MGGNRPKSQEGKEFRSQKSFLLISLPSCYFFPLPPHCSKDSLGSWKLGVGNYDLWMSVEYLIKQYGLQQGALEIQYIEEFFLDFPRKKSAMEVMQRLSNRDHQNLMAEAALPEEPGTFVPVSFKVAHELRAEETDPKLADLVAQLEDCVEFDGRRVLYQWIGGTRSDWRGQGHFRALTEEQEVWAMDNGFDEVIDKTKNRFYEMRSTPVRHHPVRAAPGRSG